MSAARRPALDIISHSPDQTRALGAHLGRLLPRGSLVLLRGQIGAGKTTFVQGLARPLQIADRISSPTFTLVAEHAGSDAEGRPLRLYHVDLYRLDGEGELETIGLEDVLDDPNGITVVEWPERARGSLPPNYLLVELEHVADTKRRLGFLPYGEPYQAIVSRLRAEVQGNRG